MKTRFATCVQGPRHEGSHSAVDCAERHRCCGAVAKCIKAREPLNQCRVIDSGRDSRAPTSDLRINRHRAEESVSGRIERPGSLGIPFKWLN